VECYLWVFCVNKRRRLWEEEEEEGGEEEGEEEEEDEKETKKMNKKSKKIENEAEEIGMIWIGNNWVALLLFWEPVFLNGPNECKK